MKLLQTIRKIANYAFWAFAILVGASLIISVAIGWLMVMAQYVVPWLADHLDGVSYCVRCRH